ncbi:unnamed protein product [Commensalibacter communis]|uniref:Uncharacterized protein n=2 Tax=Commensalibacter communis TaxID=2972786 RepID=A0A9W4X7S0_9PROT|nr:unnamed protein product [Commensalibacter communis]CAI3957577.1 unnamed protein product [Commensalibacter communis]CAI3957690.1 unnamed protein product [Commensalibacter communis]CAI3959176.1 unnamed protein product [Commensalibacter communis]CAI3959726.1 unnamed protein product [Commensalibacter communis]
MGRNSVFFYAFLMEDKMNHSDLMMQIFQSFLDVIPGDIAGNIVAVVTSVATMYKLIARYMKKKTLQKRRFKRLYFL